MISADSVTEVERNSRPLSDRSRWGDRCAWHPETPHRASFLEPVVPCDCSLVTVSLRSVRRDERFDRQSMPLSRCHPQVDRDGGNSFQADATNTPHVDGLDVTHCDRRDYRTSAAANNLSRRTEHSSPAENNRIFLKIRLCDGPPLARWTSLRRHPAKRPHAADNSPSPAFEPGCAARVVGLCRAPSRGTPARLAKLPSDDSRHGTHSNRTAAKRGADRKEQSHPFSRQILRRGA